MTFAGLHEINLYLPLDSVITDPKITKSLGLFSIYSSRGGGAPSLRSPRPPTNRRLNGFLGLSLNEGSTIPSDLIGEVA